MNEKKIGIALGIVNIVLLSSMFFFYFRQDRTEPVINIENVSLVYEEGIPDSQLLVGVSANDDKDGDISESLVIEKVVTDPDKETAVITYGVRDVAGNMVKASRSVKMLIKKAESEETKGNSVENTSEENTTEEDSMEGDSIEGNTMENNFVENDSIENNSAENNSGEGEPGNNSEPGTEGRNIQEETDALNREDSEAERENQNLEQDNENSDPENQDNEAGMNRSIQENADVEEHTSQEQRGEVLPTAGEASNDIGEIPSIVLRAQEVTTKKGFEPAWVTVIEGLHDDKDNYEYLLEQLKVNGSFDQNTTGTYSVTVTTTDSDGNESPAYPIKIIVEE